MRALLNAAALLGLLWRRDNALAALLPAHPPDGRNDVDDLDDRGRADVGLGAVDRRPRGRVALPGALRLVAADPLGLAPSRLW